MEKICLVTGANSGIGQATAHALAAQGATVILVCRNRVKGEAALAEIKRRTGSDKLDLLLAELADQAQIRRLAAEVKSKYSRLDVLVNNAGAYHTKRTLTGDGYETTFAVNHLAYFLLTVDLLKASAPARIVNVSSGAHRGGRIHFDDPHLAQRYGGWRAYAQSKLANVLFTYELARRLQGTGVTVNALHPGGVGTNFFDNLGFPFKLIAKLLRSPQKGAETVIWLASSPEVAGVTGKYFFDCRERKTNKESYDAETARRLWEVSEQMTRHA